MNHLTIKESIKENIKVLLFLSVIVVLGFILYLQQSQLSMLDNLKHLDQKQILVDKLIAEQENNKNTIIQLQQRIDKLEKNLNSFASTNKTANAKNQHPTEQNSQQSQKLTVSQKQANKSVLELKQGVQDLQPDIKDKNTLSLPAIVAQESVPQTEMPQQKVYQQQVQEVVLSKEAKKQLKQCKHYFDSNRFTRGKHGNAFTCYSSILKKYPQNKEAQYGLSQIENKYEALVAKYTKLNNTVKVKRFLASLKQINPQNPLILQLQQQSKLDPNLKKQGINKQKIANTTTKKTPPKNLLKSENFIKLKSGCFTYKKEKHCVDNSFHINRYEVTQKLWTDIMGDYPYFFKECGDNCPVENISWLDVQKFIKKLNKKTGQHYRLPSNTEWEYASRAGTSTQYFYGNKLSKLSNYGNYCDQQCTNDWKEPRYNDGAKTVIEVGSYRPNPWGLYDTIGNVWEWVEVKNSMKQSYRGGSWGDHADLNKPSSKGEAEPNFRIPAIGFRLVLDK